MKSRIPQKTILLFGVLFILLFLSGCNYYRAQRAYYQPIYRFSKYVGFIGKWTMFDTCHQYYEIFSDGKISIHNRVISFGEIKFSRKGFVSITYKDKLTHLYVFRVAKIKSNSILLKGITRFVGKKEVNLKDTILSKCRYNTDHNLVNARTNNITNEMEQEFIEEYNEKLRQENIEKEKIANIGKEKIQRKRNIRIALLKKKKVKPLGIEEAQHYYNAKPIEEAYEIIFSPTLIPNNLNYVIGAFIVDWKRVYYGVLNLHKTHLRLLVMHKEHIPPFKNLFVDFDKNSKLKSKLVKFKPNNLLLLIGKFSNVVTRGNETLAVFTPLYIQEEEKAK